MQLARITAHACDGASPTLLTTVTLVAKYRAAKSQEMQRLNRRGDRVIMRSRLHEGYSEKSVNPYVKDVRPLADYHLELAFENGERRLFDVKPYLQRGVFIRLQNVTIFKAARVVAGSVEWPGGLDLSYDTLYLESQPVAVPAIAERGPA